MTLIGTLGVVGVGFSIWMWVIMRKPPRPRRAGEVGFTALLGKEDPTGIRATVTRTPTLILRLKMAFS